MKPESLTLLGKLITQNKCAISIGRYCTAQNGIIFDTIFRNLPIMFKAKQNPTLT